MKHNTIFITLVILISILLSGVECAKILAVIPTPSISHQVPFRPLFQELVRRGHQVTVITTDPALPMDKAPKNLTEIDLHELSYDVWNNGLLKHAKGSKDDYYRVLELVLSLTVDVFDKQMQVKEVQNIIHGKENYDLLLLEAWFTGTLCFAHRFKAPVIQISSLGGIPLINHIYGAPSHALLYPQTSNMKVYNLTLKEQFDEIYRYDWTNYVMDNMEKILTKNMRKYFGEDMPPIADLKNRAEMLLANVHPVFEGNFPIPPSITYVWGIHKKPEKELPQDLKSFLDSSKHGVIYMSLGTNADPANLPPEIVQMFIKVFSELPYDVLLKWNKDELPGQSDNIRIAKWFPQSDLLRHPKVKLFVTQGGLQSTDEAISAGVPLVGLPMLGDQWYNVEKYVHLRIGERLDVETITEEKFRNTIKAVVENDRYRRNIEKLRDMMKDEPLPPLERAVWWVEYVLRHGGARHLRAPAANISREQYYEKQIVSILYFIALVAICFFYKLYVCLVKNASIRLKLKKS